MTEKIKHKRVWLIRLIVLLCLLTILEIAFRLGGAKPGVLINWAFVEGEITNDSLFYAGDDGITRYVSNEFNKTWAPINGQGFIGNVDYSKEIADSVRTSGKKIIMVVGDSYTAGCCPSSYQESFIALLSRNRSNSEFFNFGIPGTDPLQYRLIIEKYLPVIKPDLVITIVYLGNDIMHFDRPPRKKVPAYFTVKNGPWLPSEAPSHLAPAGTYFKNFDEAKEFYFSIYSLQGPGKKWYEKIVRKSVLMSKLVLGTKFIFRRFKYKKRVLKNSEVNYGLKHLKRIKNTLYETTVPSLIVMIPPPSDRLDKDFVRDKYEPYFEGLEWCMMDGLDYSDYDGRSIDNHFNERGHRKFYLFLDSLIKNRNITIVSQ